MFQNIGIGTLLGVYVSQSQRQLTWSALTHTTHDCQHKEKTLTVDLTGTYRTGFPDVSFLLCSPKMLLPT